MSILVNELLNSTPLSFQHPSLNKNKIYFMARIVTKYMLIVNSELVVCAAGTLKFSSKLNVGQKSLFVCSIQFFLRLLTSH